ncbi:hypothetical protein J2W89_003792 [Pseudarthrobacter oxydans]|uniref:hypothetical protein n=1 Tax=Pseudarthrobacter oxydans TaxID=1671 RepID=UPI002859B728|nr:hypothetical protein [Pseudarthrobacter oxydans]MDR6794610.1 hypothetical protein [Pseudarthrobacter oxydans]
MNREDRRRQEKAERQGQRSHKTVPADRLEAETQDFVAGTIFAAGAAGIHATDPGDGIPPLFVVLLDEANIAPAPELVRLFNMLDTQGTAALNAQIKGTARWGAMPAPDGQWLAKLELSLTGPVKTRPSLLLLADNYRTLWDIPASGDYLLGLTTTERFASLGPDSTYADALDACVLLPLPASNAARELHEHYSGSNLSSPAMPPLTIINGDGDDMRYQTGIAANPAMGLPMYAYMLMRPTAITQIPFEDESVPKFIATSFASRGLSWAREGVPTPDAPGWSWQRDGKELTINDADGVMAASVNVEPSGPEGQWLELIESSGRLVLYVGDELATDDGRSTKEQLMQAARRGNLVVGVIGPDNAVKAPQTATETQMHPGQEPRKLPLWRRLFRS